MAREKAISDEQIIAALLHNGTIKAAAGAVGISERTLYDRMNRGEFQALYKSAKADLIRAAVLNLNRQLQCAIDTVVEVMQDTENNPAIRLQAAQTILNNAGKFAQRLQIDETSAILQQESNKFSIW
jgi:hypothetical protein